jgi:hypothetical protein
VPETSATGTWFVPGHAPFGAGNFVKIGDAEFSNTFISLAGGGLRMRAHRNSSTSTTWYPANLATVNTSGQGFTFRYGYFETHGRFPASNTVATKYNAWCSPWLLTQNGFDNPRTTNRAELDAIEWYSGDKYSDHQTVHIIDTANVRKSMGYIQAYRPTDLSASPHSFGIKVTPTWTIYYVDRLETARFPTVMEFTREKYLLLSSAILSTASTDNGETEYNYDVDNVSVWTMPQDLQLDNTDASGVVITGSWTAATTPTGFLGTNYLHDAGTSKGSKSVKYTPALPCDGSYQVYARWTSAADRATNVPYTIVHSNGSASVTQNQTANGGTWVLLGTYSFNEGTSGSVTVANTGTTSGKIVVADAIRFVLVDPWVGTPTLPPRAPLQLDATPGNAAVTLGWLSSPGGPFVDDTSTAITYSGTWTHSDDWLYYGNSKSYSNTSGNYAQTTFTGTGVRLFTKKDASFGKADVYIDDMVTPVATIDLFNGTPIWQQKVYENLALSNGSHTIRVQLNGQKNAGSTGYTVGVDYFEILPAMQSYTVKRATTPGGPYTTIASNVTALSYSDSGLSNGTTYYYVVSAVDANGAGPNSPMATVTPSSTIQIVDNLDAGAALTGTWTASTSTPGYYGSNYIHDGNTGATGGKSVRFTPNLPVAGTYEVSLRWLTGTVRASNAPVDVVHANGTTTTPVNQQFYNGQWVPLGQFSFNAGSGGSVLLRNDAADATVIADAARFLLVETPLVIMDNLSAGVILTGAWTESTNSAGYYGTNYIHDGATGKGSKSVQFTPTLSAGTYEVFAYWPAAGTRYTAVPHTITHAGGSTTINVNQTINSATWVSLGTYTFNAGTGGNVVISNTGTSNYVIVDAVKFVRQ